MDSKAFPKLIADFLRTYNKDDMIQWFCERSNRLITEIQVRIRKEESMPEVIIKKGTIKMSLDRSELVEVSETADGIAFNFKGGLQLYLTDNFMPSGMKQIIKNTADSYPGKKLVFDLDNQRHPAMVDAT